MQTTVSGSSIRDLSDELKLLSASDGESCVMSFSNNSITMSSDGGNSCSIVIDVETEIKDCSESFFLRKAELISLLIASSKNKKTRDLSISASDGKFSISSTNSVYKMRYSVASDNCKIPDTSSCIELSGSSEISSSIDDAAKFCESGKLSPLSGVLLSSKDGSIAIAATDSIILMEKKIKLNCENFSSIIPSRFAKMIPSKVDSIFIDKSGTYIVAKSKNFTSKIPCISGKYPNYGIILKDFTTDCIIDRDEFKTAISEVREIAPKAECARAKFVMDGGTASIITDLDNMSAKSSMRYTPKESSHKFWISLDKLKSVVDACRGKTISIGYGKMLTYVQSGDVRFAIASMIDDKK